MTTTHQPAEQTRDQGVRDRAASRQTGGPAGAARPAPGVAALIRLQRAAGNAAVSAMLAREAAPEVGPVVQREGSVGVAGVRGQFDRLVAAPPAGAGAPPGDGQAPAGPPTPEHVAAKKAEMRAALPVPSEAAEQGPRIQEAAGAARQEAERPPEPLVPAKNVPKPGGAAGAAATAAAGLADQAQAMTAPDAPSAPPEVELPEPVAPVDAGGTPLPPDPGGDAATAGIARQIQQLRQGGHALRDHAAKQVATAHAVRGRIQLGMGKVAEAESGIGTLKDHTDHRREVVTQAKSALEVSEQKADTVGQQAPGLAAKGSEGKQKSGPMASEAGSLASENAGKRPDDADAAAKSQEQGQKLTRAGGDLTSMDTAIGQTQQRAEGLVDEAAQAKSKNATSRSKIGESEAALAQTDAKVAEMTGQNETAKTQLTGLQAGPTQMLGQAATLDEQGQAAIQASVALERRLHGNEAAFREGMAAVPARRPVERGVPVQRQETPGARTQVELGAGAPSWLSGADPVTEQQRREAQARERARRQSEIAEINQQAGGNFQNLSAGQKAGMALSLTGRHLMSSVGATSIPGLVGGILRGFVDPRVSLMGIVHGLSMIVSGVANLFSAEQWRKDPLGNLLQSAADIATGIAIVLGSIAMLAMAIIVILGALTILSFGAASPLAAVVIPFCWTVVGTVGPWAVTAAEIALVLQGLLFIKNLIDAATASTAEELQGRSDAMTEDTKAAGQMAAQIGMAKLGEAVLGGGSSEGAPAPEGGAPPEPTVTEPHPVDVTPEGNLQPAPGPQQVPIPDTPGGGGPPSGIELDTGPPGGGQPSQSTVLEPHPVEVTPEGDLQPVPGPQQVPIPDTPGAGQPPSGLDVEPSTPKPVGDGETPKAPGEERAPAPAERVNAAAEGLRQTVGRVRAKVNSQGVREALDARSDGGPLRGELGQQLRDLETAASRAQDSARAAADDPSLSDLAQEDIDAAQRQADALERRLNEIEPRTEEQIAEAKAAAAEQARVEARRAAAARGADLVRELKEQGVGQEAGRSGGHGTPYKQAGSQLIREGNALPESDPMHEALKTEGQQLIDYGNQIDHPGGNR